MANKQFTDLTVATQVGGTDVLPIQQSGTTKQLTFNKISVESLSGGITKAEVVSMSAGLDNRIVVLTSENGNQASQISSISGTNISQSSQIVQLIALSGALQSQKIGDAPANGSQYARINNTWAIVQTTSGGGGISDAPADSQQYARINNNWAVVQTPSDGSTKVEVSSVSAGLDTRITVLTSENSNQSNQISSISGTNISQSNQMTSLVAMTGSLQNQATTNSNNINSLISLTGALQTQKIGDAPADSQQYARINNAWAVVQTTSGGGGSVNAPTDGVVYGITGSSYIPLISRTSAGANTRTGLSSDRFVSFTGLTSAQSYILPEANSVPAGTPIVIANEDGTCKPYLKILVTPAGTDLLNGIPAISGQQDLIWPYSTVTVVSNGTNGWMVSNVHPVANNGALTSYKGAIICDEDWFYPQSGNQNGWRMQNSGTTMNTAQTQTILGGSVLSCGTSAQYSGFGFANPAIGGIMIPRYYSNFFCEWRLNLTLFDLTNNAKLFVGFFNSIATDPTRGAYFEINTNSGATNASTNWTATIMPRTGVTVRQDTGIAFGTAGIWTLGVDVTYGGDTRFYINGVLATTITTPYSDSTSNSADNVTPAIRGQGVAGSARNADIDRTRFGMIMNPVTHLRYS